EADGTAALEDDSLAARATDDESALADLRKDDVAVRAIEHALQAGVPRGHRLDRRASLRDRGLLLCAGIRRAAASQREEHERERHCELAYGHWHSSSGLLPSPLRLQLRCRTAPAAPSASRHRHAARRSIPREASAAVRYHRPSVHTERELDPRTRSGLRTAMPLRSTGHRGREAPTDAAARECARQQTQRA